MATVRGHGIKFEKWLGPVSVAPLQKVNLLNSTLRLLNKIWILLSPVNWTRPPWSCLKHYLAMLLCLSTVTLTRSSRGAVPWQWWSRWRRRRWPRRRWTRRRVTEARFDGMADSDTTKIRSLFGQIPVFHQNMEKLLKKVKSSMLSEINFSYCNTFD